MIAEHPYPGGAAAVLAGALDKSDHAERKELLLQRTRVAIAMVTGAVVLTTVIDLPVGDVRPALLLQLKAIDLGLLAVAYALTRWSRAQPYATVVAWSIPATVCAMLALSGIATGDSHGAMILCVGAALITASIFPWGVRTQLAAAACAGAAIVANLHWVTNDAAIAVSYQAITAAALTLIASVVITYERQVIWRAMRKENKARARAEAQTATLNQHLEGVVIERTALLEATKQDLERQIADHRATLHMLRDKEQQLLDIVDNSSAIVYVKNLDGRYRFMGIQGARRIRMQREQIIGKTATDLFSATTAAASAVSDRIVLATDRALETEDILEEPEGARTFLTVRFPLRDTAGFTYGLCGISTDITPRKQMEAELRRTEALLSSVIESSNEAIWSLDRHYRFTALNSAVKHRFRALFGTEPKVGASLDDCLPANNRAYWRRQYEQALSGRPLAIEQEITFSGRPQQLLISLNPVIEDGTVSGVVVSTKEITVLKRAEEQARQHQAELAHALRLSTIGEMTTGLAHDLRRPLAVIAHIAQDCRQELQSGCIDPAAFAQRISQVTGEALGAAESLRHLLRLVRKHSATDGGIDVNEVTRSAVRIVELSRHPELSLQLTLAPDLPQVHGDRIQIEQVVLNLLLNGLDALQAVPSHERTLAVQTSRVDGTAIEVAVRDTGGGLNPAVREKLFKPFVTTKPKRLGMGLAISRSIVEAHGGQLWVTPDSERGTVFHFTLPLP